MVCENNENILPVEEHIKLLVFGEAHKHPCDTCKVSEIDHSLPPWFDREKYKRGQRYIKNNAAAHTLGTLCGVMALFGISTILTILMKTHRSSSVFSAYRRYLSTIKHFHSWYVNELKPGTDAWKSLRVVRERHIKWSHISVLKKDGHISQRDLVLTLNAFGGLSLVRPHLLGMSHDNRKDLEAFSHFWRTIGYMIGIQDKYNPFRPSLDETLLVSEALCVGVYKPTMENPPEYFYHMKSAFIQGLWYLDPSISEGALHYFTYRLLGCEGYEYTKKGAEITQAKENRIRQKQLENINFKKGLGYSDYEGKDSHPMVTGDKFYEGLGWYNRIVLFFMIFSFEHIYKTKIGKIFMGLKGLFSLILAKYFPIMIFLKFGFKDAYVNKYDEDIKVEVRMKTNSEMIKEIRY